MIFHCILILIGLHGVISRENIFLSNSLTISTQNKDKNGSTFCTDKNIGDEMTMSERSESRIAIYHRNGKWISEIFAEARESFSISKNASTNCRHDFLSYKRSLNHQLAWAIRMLESSEWPQVGIFSGNTYHLGNYDECLRISVDNIKGKYCLVETVYNKIDYLSYQHENDYVEWPEQEISVWDAINMYQTNPVRMNRKVLHWALCIPSSCSHFDLENSLNFNLKPIFSEYGFNVSAKIQSEDCYVKEMKEYSSGYYNVRLILYVVVLLVLFSTGYHILRKEEDGITRFLKRFSILYNCKKLFIVKPQEDLYLHTMKFSAMLFTIYGHRHMYVLSVPIFDTETMEMKHKAFKCTKLIHMPFVELFIVVSAIIKYRYDYPKIQKGGFKIVVILAFRRWLRMVPTFTLLMFYLAYILPLQNDGPLWNEIVKESELCKSYWWLGFLGISNVIEADKYCFFGSWFISVDLQLALFGGLLLLIIAKKPHISYHVFSSTVLLSTSFVFFNIFKNCYNGIILFNFDSVKNIRLVPEFTKLYVALSVHVGPHIMGIVTARLCIELKERNYKFSKFQMICGSILSTIIGESFIYYGSLFYEYGREYNALENAIYGSLHRMFFVLPFLVIYLMFHVNGIRIAKLHGFLKFFVLLSRLSYSVFLLNFVIQTNHVYSQRTSLPIPSFRNEGPFVIADIIQSYVFGFFLHIFIEAPLGNIETMINNKFLS